MASSSKRNKSDRVRNLEHFFKNFLQPYGKASEAITDDMMQKRLTTFNCEFLNRPGYAFSEFTESLPMPWAGTIGISAAKAHKKDGRLNVFVTGRFINN